MRLSLALAAFAAVLLPSASLAATNRVCSAIDLLSPASGHHFIGTRPIHFSWSGEPAGTVSRELHLAALDGSEVVMPLDGRFSDTVKVKMTGDLGWAVVFKDANGKVLCTSPAGLLHAGSGSSGGQAVGSMESLAGPGSPGAAAAGAPPQRLVVGFTNNGRLVIVLQDTPYTGQYSKLVADGYDMSTEDLMAAIGVEFHGNGQDNVVTGSLGNDLIWLYDGNDHATGGLGDDILVGGNGNDILDDTAGGSDTDVLYGGPGRDRLLVDDGDGNDVIDWGTAPEPNEFASVNNGDTVFGVADGPAP